MAAPGGGPLVLLLPAALHVALHELLGILFEDIVDLVQEVIEILLDLLALFGELRVGPGGVVVAVGLGRPRLLLLLFSHERSPPGPEAGAGAGALDRREDDPLLALVLPLPIRIGRLAGLIGLEKEDLGDPLVGVDLGRQRRGVADLERHEAFPLGLERRDIRDDAAAGIRGLAHADREDVARDLEVLHRSPEREGVRRHDAHVALVVHEGASVEALRIDEGVVDVREDLELVGDPEIVAVGGQAVRDHTGADLPLLEGLDHPPLEGLRPDPPVTLDHALTVLGLACSDGIAPLERESSLAPSRTRTGDYSAGFQVAPTVSTGRLHPRPTPPDCSSARSMARATGSGEPRTAASREGPAPDRAQPSAPASTAARRTVSIHGKSGRRCGWWSRSSMPRPISSGFPAPSAARRSPMRWRLNTASARDTVTGSTARASLVELWASGTRTTQVISAGTCRYTAATLPSTAHETVRPRRRAAATLSGWPSARQASASTASRSSGEPRLALAATRPPTQAAALEPRPRAGGMRLTQWMA